MMDTSYKHGCRPRKAEKVMLTPSQLEISPNPCWVPWARPRLAVSIPFFRAVAVACTLEYGPMLGPSLGWKESLIVVNHEREALAGSTSSIR